MGLFHRNYIHPSQICPIGNIRPIMLKKKLHQDFCLMTFDTCTGGLLSDEDRLSATMTQIQTASEFGMKNSGCCCN